MSYYDDAEFGPIMRERDEDAITAHIAEKERRPVIGRQCADADRAATILGGSVKSRTLSGAGGVFVTVPR